MQRNSQLQKRYKNITLLISKITCKKNIHCVSIMKQFVRIMTICCWDRHNHVTICQNYDLLSQKLCAGNDKQPKR